MLEIKKKTTEVLNTLFKLAKENVHSSLQATLLIELNKVDSFIHTLIQLSENGDENEQESGKTEEVEAKEV